MKRLVLPFLFCGLLNGLYAQSGSLVFNDTVLHEIRITFSYSAWFDSLNLDYQLNLSDTPGAFPERNFACSMTFDNIFMDSVGMRQRGNFSNFSATFTNPNGLKKPFKLNFDAFRDNQEFDGLKSLNLNNGTDDPSFVREALVYKLLRQYGIPASRTSFAKLYVNNAYWGLYELVENVDKRFLRDHYGSANNDGNLYKTGRGAAVTLDYLGENYFPYQSQGLLLKTNETDNNWTNLIHFIYVINHTPASQLETELGNIFDVHAYLKVLALEVLCYSWDSYWGGGNNFYLYEHPDGKIRWIPWDFNETFSTHNGILSILLPDENDIFLSTRIDQRPLLKAVFSVRKWQDEYLDNICEMCTNSYWSPALAPTLHRWHDLVRDALAADTNALGSMQSFDLSLTTDVDNLYQVPSNGVSFNISVPGLLPYLAKQRAWAVDQIKFQQGSCPLADAGPSSYPVTVYPNPTTSLVNLQWDQLTTGIYQLMVFSTCGEKVLGTGWIVNDNQLASIDASVLPKGFYIVKKLDADGNWAIGKFIKY
jgi:spore coat protein CotH